MRQRIILQSALAAAISTIGSAAYADAPQPAPMAQPVMLGPLVANPNPTGYEVGSLGKVYVTGILSAYGQVQDNVVPGDKAAQGDLSNAQIIVQKADGQFQFYIQAGAYSLPDLGLPYIRATQTTSKFFGLVPVAFAKWAPTDSFSIQAGNLPTLIGAEVTFDFEDLNIERGLLWNQENAVNRGVQVNYTSGPLQVMFAVTDGFYSGQMTWLVGCVNYTIAPGNVLTFTGGANTSTDTKNTLVTPVLLNNEQIYNLIYTYTSGPWIVSPYLQYSYVPKNPLIGAPHDASVFGGALLASYNFEPEYGLTGFSLAGRVEYIASSGNQTDGTPNLMYGPGSKGWSVTLTPTYQRGVFFARAEGSYVAASDTAPGAVFGPAGDKTSQLRGVLELGVVF